MAESVVESTRAENPWILVVARGDGPLLAELEAMFRHDPRVRVIENRRRDAALLPRRAGIRLDLPAT